VNIKNKIFFSYLITLFIPIIILSYIFFTNFQSVVEKEVLLKLHSIAKFEKMNIEHLLLHSVLDAERLLKLHKGRHSNNLRELISLSRDRTNKVYMESKKALDHDVLEYLPSDVFFGFSLLDLKGRIVYSSVEGDRLWKNLPAPSKEILSEWKKGTWLSDVYRFEDNNNSVVMYQVLPIVDEEGARPFGFGVFGLNVSAIHKKNIQEDLSFSKTGEIILVKKINDKKALIINELMLNKEIAFKQEIDISLDDKATAKALQGEEGGGLVRDYFNRPVFASWLYIDSLKWGLVVKMDKNEALINVTRLKKLTLLILLFTLIILSLMSYSVSNSIADPIRKLIAYVDGISLEGEDIGTGLIIKNEDETTSLTKAFVKMLDKLDKRDRDLKNSEERFRTIVNEIDGYVWEVELQAARYTYASDAVYNILGYSAEEMIGKTIFDIAPQEEKETLEYFVRFVSETRQKVSDFENKVLRKDGVELTMLTTAIPIFDEKGELVAYRGIDTDISKRKKIESIKIMQADILKTLNDRSIDIYDSIKQIVEIVKKELNLDAVALRLEENGDYPYLYSDGFTASFIETEKTLLSTNKEGGICRNEDGSPCLECTCGLVISGNTDPSNPLFTKRGSAWTNDSEPFLHVPLDQDPRTNPRNRCIHDGYSSIALIPIRSTEEKIVGLLQLNDRRKNIFIPEIIELLEDICSSIGSGIVRKKLEKELRESEAFVKIALDNLPIGVAVNTVFPRVELKYVNSNFAKIYKVRTEDLADPDSFWDIVYEDESFRKKIKERVLKDCASGDPKRMIWEEIPVSRKGKDTFYISASNIPIPDQGLFISTVWDVTEHVEAKNNKEKLQELQVQSKVMDLKEKILSMTSHDLKSPLTIIRRAVLLMLDKPNLGNELKGHLDIVLRQAVRGLKFINDFFNLRKLKDGVLKLEKSEFEFSKLLEGVEKDNSILLQRAELNLNISFEKDCLVFADYGKMEQVLGNLIDNAIKHTPKGGKIDIAFLLEGKKLKVSVTDTGEGIPQENIPKLFEYYEQVRDADALEGTGMGLPIAKYIVELHGGKIWAESVLGEGTSFFFTIPNARPLVVGEDIKKTRKKTAKSKDISTQKNILLVDDLAEDRLVTRLFLEENGFTVYEAEAWRAALKKIRSGSIDALILDVQMPEISGLELLDIIRREKSMKDLPAIFYSSKLIDKKTCKKHGASSYVNKADKTVKLLLAVKKLFNS
jgi:PAS domain S-box-containing protein